MKSNVRADRYDVGKIFILKKTFPEKTKKEIKK